MKKWLFVLLCCASCVQSGEKLASGATVDENSGAPSAHPCFYKFANDLSAFRRRYWYAEYWTLTLDGDKGLLVFTEAGRGLYSFELNVTVSRRESTTTVRFDSVKRVPAIRGEKLDTLRKGEKLLELTDEQGVYSIPFECVTQLQYKKLKPGIVQVKRMCTEAH